MTCVYLDRYGRSWCTYYYFTYLYGRIVLSRGFRYLVIYCCMLIWVSAVAVLFQGRYVNIRGVYSIIRSVKLFAKWFHLLLFDCLGKYVLTLTKSNHIPNIRISLDFTCGNLTTLPVVAKMLSISSRLS